MNYDSDDISQFIHTIEFLIRNFEIQKKTIKYYSKNDKFKFKLLKPKHNKNISVKKETISNKAKKRISHLRIIIPDLGKSKITSFHGLKDHLHKKFMKLIDKYDKDNLLWAYNNKWIKLVEMHVYNRVSCDDETKRLFDSIKKHARFFEIFLPNIVSINTSNENSIYFNFTNKKTIDIYYEYERRQLKTYKLELRFSHNDNMINFLSLTSGQEDHLIVNNCEKIRSAEIKKGYNRFLRKYIKQLIIRKSNKSSDEIVREIIKCSESFVNDPFLFNIASTKPAKNQLKNKNKSLRMILEGIDAENFTPNKLFRLYAALKNEIKSRSKILHDIRKDLYTELLFNRGIDRDVHDYLEKNYPNLFLKIYCNSDSDKPDNFFTVISYPMYYFSNIFYNYRDINIKNNIPLESWMKKILDGKKHLKYYHSLPPLSPEEHQIIRDTTLSLIKDEIDKIRKKYTMKPTLEIDKEIIDGMYNLFFGIKSEKEIFELDDFRRYSKQYLSHFPEYHAVFNDLKKFLKLFYFNFK